MTAHASCPRKEETISFSKRKPLCHAWIEAFGGYVKKLTLDNLPEPNTLFSLDERQILVQQG